MATITLPISLDVSLPNYLQPIQAKQYDSDSRFLDVTVLNQGERIVIASGSVVVLNVRRADGQSNSYSGTVNEDGTVRVPLTSWTLGLDDVVYASVSIISGDERLTTLSFTIDVQEAESSAEPAPDPPDIWAQALQDIEDLKEDVADLQDEVGDINTILATLVTVGE